MSKEKLLNFMVGIMIIYSVYSTDLTVDCSFDDNVIEILTQYLVDYDYFETPPD